MAKYKLHKTFKPRKHTSVIPHGVSKEELEVRNFIALEFPGTPIYESDRTILHGREIDIWIPSRRLAVEFDGLFYHSADSKSRYYHLWKTVECEKQDIQMIHVFSDEWERRKPVVIDLIRKTLGKYHGIDAADCIFRPLSPKEGHDFIEGSDVRGDSVRCVRYAGLFLNNDLMAAMGYDDSGPEMEIYRYSERRLSKVSGGVGRILDELAIDKPVVAYVDRRLEKGWDFIDAGFEKTSVTEPSVWFTKDFKSKMEHDAVRLDESQAKSQGLSAIYDCGDIVFRRAQKKEG